MELFNKGVEGGTISASELNSQQNMSELYQNKEGAYEKDANLVKKAYEGHGIKETHDAVTAARSTLREVFKNVVRDGGNADALAAFGGEEEFLKSMTEKGLAKNTDDLDPTALAEALQKDAASRGKNITKEQAVQLATSSKESAYSEYNNIKDIDQYLGTAAQTEEQKAAIERVQKRKELETSSVKVLTEAGYIRNSDAGFAEKISQAAGTAYNQMKKDGGPVTPERMMEFLKTMGDDLLGGGTEKQLKARVEREMRKQQHATVFGEEKERLMKDEGKTEEEATELAGKKANDEVYGKNHFEVAEAERFKKDKERFLKERQDNGVTGAQAEEYAQKKAEELSKKRYEDEYGKEVTEKATKEESAKDQMTERLITAIEQNTAASLPLSPALRSLSTALSKIPLVGGLFNSFEKDKTPSS